MPAVVVGGIIAAAGAVGSAEIQSHAAGKATDAEVKANTNALTVAQQQQQQAQQMLQPFVSGQANPGLRNPVSGAGEYTPGVGLTQPRQSFATQPPSGFSSQMGAPMAPMGGNAQAGGTATPTPGTRKTFPNGKTGVWDGRGWVAQ